MPIKTKYVFGVGYVDKLALELQELSSKKILIVTDKGVKGGGLIERVQKPLEGNDLTSAVYDEVQPEPTMQDLNSIVTLSRRQNYDWCGRGWRRQLLGHS